MRLPVGLSMDTDRNLLFGLLALQLELLNAEQFTRACQAWGARKGAPLGDILVELGLLTPCDRADVDRLLEHKLTRYECDGPQGLAGGAHEEFRRALTIFEDPSIQSSLAKLPQHKGHVLLSTLRDDGDTRERYTLTHLHATGGIGQVWLARDGELGRDVALKELRPDRAEHPAAWARFLDEARITGQLEHPGIIPIYELSRRPEDHQPFYTMRFVRGRTLTEEAGSYHEKLKAGQAGPLDLLVLLNGFVGACNAVAYAHARGVIHRDLKGQNVVLGDFGEVMVLDWGLAKLMGRSERSDELPPVTIDPDERRDHTIEGQALGTPAYMPPEQAAGRSDLVDERSDVYGLGAILYEILTGQPPFTDPDTREVLRKVREEPPPRPRSICPSAPRALEAVCLKAMAKRPEDRYPSALELACEVKRYLADEPVHAWCEPMPVQVRRWVSNHRTLVTAGAMTILVATLSLAANNWSLSAANERERAAHKVAQDQRDIAEDQKGQAQEQKDIAQKQRQIAENRFTLAQEAVVELLTKVGESQEIMRPGLQPLRERLMRTALEFQQKLVQDRDNDLGSQLILGETYTRLGRITAEIGSKRDALEAFRKNAEIIEKLLAIYTESPADCPFHRQLAHCYNHIGVVQGELGHEKDALATHEKSRRMWQEMVDKNPNDHEARTWLAWSYNNAAVLHYQTGRLTEALALFQKAHDLFKEHALAEPNDKELQRSLGASYLNAGEIQHKTGHESEAMASLRQARKILEPLVARDPEDLRSRQYLTEVLINFGDLYRQDDRRARAAHWYRKAREIVEGLVAGNPTVTRYRSDLADCLLHIGRLEHENGETNRALGSLQEARDVVERVIAVDPNVPESRRILAEIDDMIGLVQGKAGHATEAMRSHQKAREALEGLVAANPSVTQFQGDLARSYHNIGILEREAGHTAEALHFLRRAREIREKLVALNPSVTEYRRDLAESQHQLGVMHRRVGQPTDALRFFQQARETREKLAETSANALYRLACTLAQCSTRVGRDGDDTTGCQDADQAIKVLRRAIDKGYHDRELLEHDPDLDPLRSRDDFEELLTRVQEAAEAEPADPA